MFMKLSNEFFVRKKMRENVSRRRCN